MHDLLAAIVACARTTVEGRRATTPLDVLVHRGEHRAPRGALFGERLARLDGVNVIAECKRRSPARGILARDYRPEQIAARYAEGGAAAISVLTEPCFFDGDLDHLARVRRTVDIPVLRKDFVVDEYQIYEAVAAGADAVLLIVAALTQAELARLLRMANGRDLAVLVEVHTREELSRAADAGAVLIGVNCRNLHTLDVDVRVFDELGPWVPPHVVAVAESGLASVDGVRRLRAAGYRAFLIGEWLMAHDNPAALVRQLAAGASA